MKRQTIVKLDAELSDFLDEVFSGIGRAERRRALRMYVAGLLGDAERKTIEGMTRRLIRRKSEFQSTRQRMQQAVSVSAWADDFVLERIARIFEERLPGLQAFVFDDTGIPKKGEHSVGVARQYSGTLGRIENCQVAVSLHVAGDKHSGCVGARLFLPESWMEDEDRRDAVGIPSYLRYQTKPQIALDLLDNALSWGVRKHVVLADVGYGKSRDLRQALEQRGLQYSVGVASDMLVWPPGSNPYVPVEPGKMGRPKSRAIDDRFEPIAVGDLAKQLTFRDVTWRHGSKGPMTSAFARVRVRSAERRTKGMPPGEEQWLLCEWPPNEASPSKFYLSNLPKTTTMKRFVKITKLRYRVERDYEDLKGEVGLDHFEGRTWRGFHHHVTLCLLAHAFLALQRALFPPAHSVDARGSQAQDAAGVGLQGKDMPNLQTARADARVSAGSLRRVIG